MMNKKKLYFRNIKETFLGFLLYFFQKENWVELEKKNSCFDESNRFKIPRTFFFEMVSLFRKSNEFFVNEKSVCFKIKKTVSRRKLLFFDEKRRWIILEISSPTLRKRRGFCHKESHDFYLDSKWKKVLTSLKFDAHLHVFMK